MRAAALDSLKHSREKEGRMDSAYKTIAIVVIVMLVGVTVYQQFMLNQMRTEVAEVSAKIPDEVATLRADISRLAQLKTRFWELASIESELASTHRAEQLGQTLMLMHASMSLSYSVQGRHSLARQHSDSSLEYEGHLEYIRAKYDDLVESKVAILNRP